MDESIVLNDPVILIGYLIVLAIEVYAIVKKAHWSASLFAVLLFAAVTTYALLVGAHLYELGAVAAVLFAVKILPTAIGGGK